MSNQPEEVQTEALKARQRDQVRRLYQWARALLLCKIELTPDFILAQLAFMDVENPEAILLIAIQYANQHANAARWRCRGDYDTQDDIDWDALETCAQEAASAFMEACAAIQAEQDQYRVGGPDNPDPLSRLAKKMTELDATVSFN